MNDECIEEAIWLVNNICIVFVFSVKYVFFILREIFSDGVFNLIRVRTLAA